MFRTLRTLYRANAFSLRQRSASGHEGDCSSKDSARQPPAPQAKTATPGFKADPEFFSLIEPEPKLGKPTEVPAVSEEKVRIIERYLARGESLFNDADSWRRVGESSFRGQGEDAFDNGSPLGNHD